MNACPIRLLIPLLLALSAGACGDPVPVPDEPTSHDEAGPAAPAARYDPEELRAERDRFPSLTDPAYVSGDVSWLRPDDQVIGVAVGGEARAYPTWIIGYHHLVNDHLGGTPILVAY